MGATHGGLGVVLIILQPAMCLTSRPLLQTEACKVGPGAGCNSAGGPSIPPCPDALCIPFLCLHYSLILKAAEHCGAPVPLTAEARK